jgi:aspartyl protease family protein
MSMSGPLTFAGVVVAAVLLFAPRAESPSSPQATAVQGETLTSVEPDATGNGYASSELERSSNGQFYAEARVNGASVRFLVDTGASVVALTPADAQRAGIALPSERATATGAGGEVEIRPVTIDQLALGPLAARDVRAAIVDDLPVSLLGQSFLSRVGTVEIAGDRMVLR